ncbi:hypothetical protein AVEN_232902-1 [Araneus ventricosus]|uniref:Uncharacterized protein n=1 Tax=Araneus ventricosus TaxID=182803 RepID=A0A4Y2FX39_ARAVE|nr:hypothetical protein AVEN_232902-1 [Araneus ventricosus]
MEGKVVLSNRGSRCFTSAADSQSSKKVNMNNRPIPADDYINDNRWKQLDKTLRNTIAKLMNYTIMHRDTFNLLSMGTKCQDQIKLVKMLWKGWRCPLVFCMYPSSSSPLLSPTEFPSCVSTTDQQGDAMMSGVRSVCRF